MSEYETVSIVIPIYNERSTIERVLEQVRVAPTFDLAKEIILVDDCSTDGTAQFLKSQNDPSLKIIFHARNQGKGAALKTGFAQAAGDIVVVQDADLEYDPAEIQKVLIPFIENNVKVVYGSRYLTPNKNLEFWHSFFNQLFTRLSNVLLGQKLTDIMTCYKAFNRVALNQFLPRLKSKRFGFEPEVTARLAKAGFKIIEVPISYKPRSKGEGKHMNFKGQLESLAALIRYGLFN